MTALITSGYAFEDGAALLMARARTPAGVNLVQSDISTVSYQVFYKDAGIQVVSGSLVVSDVIFNSLQTPSIWDVDTIGYNFRHDPPATTLPEGDTWFRFEYKLTPVAGAVIWIPFEVFAKRIYTS